MSHGILSAKLKELEREFYQIQENIRLGEKSSHEQLSQELARLRQKSERERLDFQTKLRFSRSPAVAKLASSYEKIETFVDKEKLERDGPFSDEWRKALTEEESVLLAEYALDFASQAANHALLLSLEAVDAQKERETKKAVEP